MNESHPVKTGWFFHPLPYGKSIIVGASIARPRRKTCEFAEIQCEFVHRTARTANGRPYMFISFAGNFAIRGLTFFSIVI